MNDTSCQSPKDEAYATDLEKKPGQEATRLRLGRIRLSLPVLLGNLRVAMLAASFAAATASKGVVQWRRAQPFQRKLMATAGAIVLLFIASYFLLGLGPGETILLLLLLANAQFSDSQFFRV